MLHIEAKLRLKESQQVWLREWAIASIWANAVHVGRFGEAVGRAAYAWGAQACGRTCFAPIYAFVSRSGRRRDVERVLPVYALVVISHMAGSRQQLGLLPSAECRIPWPGAPRVDAMAAGDVVGIGGWLLVRDPDGRLSKALSPWLASFRKHCPGLPRGIPRNLA